MAEYRPLGVSQDYLKELFDLRDGQLFWKVNRKMAKAGTLAGGLMVNGYWRVGIDGRSLKRSKLVWMYVYGEDPYPDYIDHINRIRHDDRIENLRKVSFGENQSNRSWGTSRSRYVYLTEDGTWRVRVSIKDTKTRISLGAFATESEAIQVVENWERNN